MPRTNFEPDVALSSLLRSTGSARDELGVRVEAGHILGEGRHAQREATIAAPKVEDPLAAYDGRATPMTKLHIRGRTERG